MYLNLNEKSKNLFNKLNLQYDRDLSSSLSAESYVPSNISLNTIHMEISLIL